MVPTLQEGLALAEHLKKELPAQGKTRVTVHPPFPGLKPVGQILAGSRIGLGAQDMHWEEKGAYTGEVSAPMLMEVGCQYVIIGHSERRQFFGETNETASKKVASAVKHGLCPILCVGETLEERKKGNTLAKVESQVREGLAGIAQAGPVVRFVMAYEPVWAIGTGVTPKPEEAQEVHGLIRRTLQSLMGAAAETVPIQYGGSVTPENAGPFLGQADIDGALVGGASLKAESFLKIIMTAEALT